MSRLGKREIVIPEKTEVSFTDGVFVVKGPQGELKKNFRDEITLNVDNGKIKLEPKKDTGLAKALWGTYSSHITNMISGVNTPYEKKLVVEGVGFKSNVAGDKLVLSLGFSHPVEIKIPDGIKATAEKNIITISGIDKEKVGEFAAKIKAKKKPEPYKGKGIRYEGEVIRRKQGKKTA